MQGRCWLVVARFMNVAGWYEGGGVNKANMHGSGADAEVGKKVTHCQIY